MITSLTCSELLNLHYSRLRRPAAATMATHRTNIRRWARVLCDSPIDQIREEDFDAFRTKAKEMNYSNDSIEGSVNAVLCLLRLAVSPKLRLIEQVPDSGTPFKISTRVKYAPSLADLGKAYLAADVAKWPQWCDPASFWKALFASALWTGLRRSDLFQSYVWDSFTEFAIDVTSKKTGKQHLLPLSSVLDRHLEPLKGLDSLRVFPVGRCHHQIVRELRRIADAAGVKRFGLQSLRRRSCSNWQAAKWGAGEVVQGSAIKGSASRYIVPEILQQAAPRFRWPEEMLTPEERDQRHGEEKRIAEAVRRLGDSERAAVLSLAEKLAT